MPASEQETWGLRSHGIFRDGRTGAGGPPRVLHGMTSRKTGNMKAIEARREALDRAGLSGRPLHLLKQVHGTDIVALRSGAPAVNAFPEDGQDGSLPLADGWVTDAAGPVLAVYAADCMPLFVWERGGRAAGVFHSGWRGTAAGMPRRAVAAFFEHFGIAAKDLVASIGPSIGPCCYRVGPELEGKFAPGSFARREGGLYLDLRAEARGQLAAAGVPEAQIAAADACTCCRDELFFSYRRDKQDSRMLAFISLESEA